MYKILLVEDAKDSQPIVLQALSRSEAEIMAVETVAEALNALNQNIFNLVVLDISLPDGSGLQVLNHLASSEMATTLPVMLLTADSNLETKIDAFNLGAEDYLVKPVDPVEFRARVEARLRKAQNGKSHLIRRGQIVIDTRLLKVTLIEKQSERLIDLTGKELKILSCLARVEGVIYSRAQLVQEVWGQVNILERTVDSHVCSLRKKLGPLGACIQSIPQEGYRFDSKAPATPRSGKAS